ncbi:RNA-binding protein Nova-1-like isoform X2 [Solea senegalensis]|uniref:RNA-binding protein Nova-1-like isoform X2 n=1 Tax=Solea senegalensis TaxID=28829 RepID=A0AAV6PWN2_SOLSE|nr:RNA-binding protein Nova-1-like isoform X2 [Solea senegalensis]
MMAGGAVQQNGIFSNPHHHNQQPHMESDPPDSRKRPLETPTEASSTKRTNTGEEGEYFLKVLIPSYAAGSIIGKGGQTIVQLQKETGATIKLSKSKDFYPGFCGQTRACFDAVEQIYGFIDDRVRDEVFRIKGEIIFVLNSALICNTAVSMSRMKHVRLTAANANVVIVIEKHWDGVKRSSCGSIVRMQLSETKDGLNRADTLGKASVPVGVGQADGHTRPYHCSYNFSTTFTLFTET